MKFSVIIPTLFRCVDIMNNLLVNLHADPAVSEVIIIDNTEFIDYTSKMEFHAKTRMYSAGKNIYVNPSWNMGVELAKEEYIAILNDDITIPEGLFGSLAQIDLKDMGVIGACHPLIQQVEKPRRFTVEQAELVPSHERTWGYGIFMAMHKDHYVELPEDILVWCGDDILYHRNRLAGRQNFWLWTPIQTRMSTTSDDKQFDEIKQNDVILYENYKKEHGI